MVIEHLGTDLEAVVNNKKSEKKVLTELRKLNGKGLLLGKKIDLAVSTEGYPQQYKGLIEEIGLQKKYCTIRFEDESKGQQQIMIGSAHSDVDDYANGYYLSVKIYNIL